MKVQKNDIINLMVICLPLCPYKIFSIGEKDISAIYLIWAILALFGVLDIKNLVRSFRTNWIALAAILYFVIHSDVINNKNVGAIAQFIALWGILFLSYRRVSREEFGKTISLFHKVMDIMAIYGIYEFIGRILHLPLSDLWITGHMVEGYNWYNAVTIGKITIFRSNGLFVEPSTFSQYLAVNILLYLFVDTRYDTKKTIKIIVSGISLVCCLAGTGILLLVFGSIFFVLSKNGITIVVKVIKRYKIWFLFIFISGIGIMFSPIGSYMFSRLAEFNPANTTSISGYIRFQGQVNISVAALKSNPYFGIGIGNVQPFIDIYRISGTAAAYASAACSMIIARYAAELGIVGLLILFFTYKVFFKKERFNELNYRILCICTLVMIPLCDSGTAVNYWFFLYLINIDFKEPA